MEVEFKKDRKNEVEFVLKGEDSTFSSLLLTELLALPEVTTAQYNIPHPETGQPLFFVKTKTDASARDALKKAAREIKKNIKAMQ